MDADKLVMLLGKVTANAQAFELLTFLVLGGSLGLDNDVAMRVGRRLSEDSLLSLIEELAPLTRGGLDPAQVQEWLKSARKAKDARNRVIHSPWHGEPDTGKMLGVLNKRQGTWEGRTAEDLQKDHEALKTAIDGAVKLLGLETIP